MPCHRLRVESRWIQVSRPPACLPLLYFCKWGHCCKRGVTNLLWGGCVQWGLLEPGMWSCSVAGWCSHPYPSPATQVKARTPGFISVPFSRCTGSRLLLGKGGGACSGEGEVQGFHSLSAHPSSRLGLHLADPKAPLSRAWRRVRNPAGPSLGGGCNGERHLGSQTVDGALTSVTPGEDGLGHGWMHRSPSLPLP